MGEYRRALAANPNHARARLGFAQALFEGSRLDVAAEAFEKAYRLDPESAREGLLSAHRDLAAALESEGLFDQARLHYQRVLDINPQDTAARVRMRDSWRATAGAHLAAGRWDKATEAYRAALRFMPDDEILQQAVRSLEQRHVESEARQRRRRQLERAVLELRLKEEQARRRQLEWVVQRGFGTVLAVAALAVALGSIVISVTAGAWNSGIWLMVVGVSLVALYATYAWITRDIS
jgi:tetratricopeptide (TPR) repeat protein